MSAPIRTRDVVDTPPQPSPPGSGTWSEAGLVCQDCGSKFCRGHDARDRRADLGSTAGR